MLTPGYLELHDRLRVLLSALHKAEADVAGGGEFTRLLGQLFAIQAELEAVVKFMIDRHVAECLGQLGDAPDELTTAQALYGLSRAYRILTELPSAGTQSAGARSIET